jgi:hypothetical protein
MSLHRWDIRDESGAADFRRHLVKPCTRVGAAVLSCDHVVKDKERRDRGPLGSVHKGNGLSGALVLLENADPFGRGQRGRSHVYVTKDRPGYLRRNGRQTKLPGKTFVGEMVVDDTRLRVNYLDLTFWAPSDDPDTEAGAGLTATNDQLDEIVLAAVGDIIAAGKSANLRAVHAAVPFRRTAVSDAVERLLLADRLAESTGARNARVFTVPQDPKEESAS